MDEETPTKKAQPAGVMGAQIWCNAAAAVFLIALSLATSGCLTLRVASLTMKELDSCQKPVIAYMTSDTPDDGGFILVVNTTDRVVFYIHGASVTMQSISREDFRRTWSGIALLPASGRMQNRTSFGLALSAGVILPLLIRRLVACKIS
jgi:hypothetical protein